MDCREVEGVWSAAHDGEPVAPEQLTEAESHCSECASCSSFRDALARLDGFGAPTAPAGMVERVMGALDEAVEAEAIAASAAIAEAARPVSPLRPILEQPRWTPRWLDRKRLWATTGAVAGVAALFSAALLWGSGALSMVGGPSQEELARQPAAAPAGEKSAATAATDIAGGYTAMRDAVAPDVVVFNGRVYVPGPSIDVSASALTTIGSVSSSFGAAGPVVSATAYRAPYSDGSIVVLTPGGLRQCPPVVRSFGGASFQLVAGRPLTRFGEWPRLPSGYPEPTSADGAPTFRQAGTDENRVPVFTPGGVRPVSGFAVAPGTVSSDPARGNPYWTWWVPLVEP
jgi:hypothetical protein